jgi:hypothetical protein
MPRVVAGDEREPRQQQQREQPIRPPPAQRRDSSSGKIVFGRKARKAARGCVERHVQRGPARAGSRCSINASQASGVAMGASSRKRALLRLAVAAGSQCPLPGCGA